jgi:hypothetical protein
MTARPGSPQFPFARFPIWPGNGEGIPDSRLRVGRTRESGNPPFPDSAGTGNRGPGTTDIGVTVPRAARRGFPGLGGGGRGTDEVLFWEPSSVFLPWSPCTVCYWA